MQSSASYHPPPHLPPVRRSIASIRQQPCTASGFASRVSVPIQHSPNILVSATGSYPFFAQFWYQHGYLMMKCTFGFAFRPAQMIVPQAISFISSRRNIPQSFSIRFSFSALHRSQRSSHDEKRKSSTMIVSKTFAARADSSASRACAFGSLQHTTNGASPPAGGSFSFVGVIMPQTSKPAARNASRSSSKSFVSTRSA